LPYSASAPGIAVFLVLFLQKNQNQTHPFKDICTFAALSGVVARW
jgi:hypothetical protein